MEKVVVAYSAAEKLPIQTADCLHGLGIYDAQGPQHMLGGGGKISLQTGPRIAETRCQMVQHFLEKFPQADWLFMVDADMTFEESIVEDLLAHADPKDVPILGGLCFAGGHASGRMYPTIYEEIDEGDGHIKVQPVNDYPSNRLVKVGATGGACLLIHRQVLLAMNRPYPNGFGTLADGRVNLYPWFVEGTTDTKGRPLGEDVVFCRRARHLGIPVHVHTGVKLGHVKTYILDEEVWLEHKAKGGNSSEVLDRAARRRAARELARAS